MFPSLNYEGKSALRLISYDARTTPPHTNLEVLAILRNLHRERDNYSKNPSTLNISSYSD